jgi:hypothetical protein
VVHQVGEGALPAGRLVHAVEVDEHAVARGGAQHFLGELDGGLVVAVEEIHHHSAPAEPCEGGEGRLDAAAQRGVVDPGPQADAALVGEDADRGEVEVVARAGRVGGGVGEETAAALRVPGRVGLVGDDRVVGDAVRRAPVEVLAGGGDGEDGLGALGVE